MKLQFSFLPIPEELMKSKAISWGAKHLFGIIAKANRERIKWSIKHFSERMDCKPRETSSRIAELRKNNLIIVGERKGKTNEYTINLELISMIQTPVQTDVGREVRNKRGSPVRSERGASHKEHSIKEKNVSPEVATDHQSLLDSLVEGKQRHIQVIGVWVQALGWNLPNKERRDSIIKRNLRPARLLVGYKNEDIIDTINVLKNTDYLKKFTLETVGKYIDEVVSKRKSQGRKILRFEEVKKGDRVVAMRPIYAEKVRENT